MKESLGQKTEESTITISFDLNVLPENNSLQDFTAKVRVSLGKAFRDIPIHYDSQDTLLSNLNTFLERFPSFHISEKMEGVSETEYNIIRDFLLESSATKGRVESLKELDLYFIGHVLAMSQLDFMKKKNMGKKTLNSLEERLHEFYKQNSHIPDIKSKVRFGMDITPYNIPSQ